MEKTVLMIDRARTSAVKRRCRLLIMASCI
jgi:hypothetical protein